MIKKSSFLTTFACQFGVAPEDDMFQRKMYETFKGLPNIFGIADDILTVGYATEWRDHDRTQRHMMHICHQEA